jgi:hypothetical protein
MTPLPLNSSPRTSTIILNSALAHSITYDPSDDSITANLPETTPLERTPYKPKLMLLIYFVQRDIQHKASHRRMDAEISLDIRIVERIIREFSNLAQAMRTLNECTAVGDFVDTTNGMAPRRTERVPDGSSKAIRMTITQEIRNTLVEWFRDVHGQVFVV